MTYREALRAAEGVGDWLVRDRRGDGPVTALSGNSVDHALVIQRLLLLCDPPSNDAGEITDKGYTNQRAVVMRRAADVERVYDPGNEERTIF